MTHSHARINRYRPNLPDSHWAAIGPVVRALAQDYGSDKNGEAVRVALIALAGFADWVFSSAAAPLTAAVLCSDLINAYEVFRRTEVAPGIAAKERKRLFEVAGIPTTREVGRTHSARSTTAVPIYTDAELDTIRDWAKWQPNRISRLSANGLVGLALGCGLRRDELVLLHRKHIHGNGAALRVDVPGPRGRQVHVDSEWADELSYAVDNTTGYLIAPRATRRTSDGFRGYFDRARGDAPVATMMRNTWLLNRVNEDHTAPEILRMSGLASLRSLEPIVRTHAPHRAALLKGARSAR